MNLFSPATALVASRLRSLPPRSRRALVTASLILACTGCVIIPPTQSADAPIAQTQRKPWEMELTGSEERVREILADSRFVAEDVIQQLGAVRMALLTERMDILQGYIDEAASKRGPNAGDSAYFPFAKKAIPGEPLGDRGLALLRTIHHERAVRFLDKNDLLSALREVVPKTDYGNLFPRGPRYYAPLASCAESETSCQRVRSALELEWPELWHGTVGATASEFHDEVTLDTLTTPKGKSRLVRMVLSSAIKTARGWIVVGADISPENAKFCDGRYETDKILDIDERRIRIERTTWCRELRKGVVDGYRVSYHIAQLPTDTGVRAEMLLLVDERKIRINKRGHMRHLTVEGADVVAIRSAKSAFLWNQEMDGSIVKYEPITSVPR